MDKSAVNGWHQPAPSASQQETRAIPDHLAPILERIGVDTSCWCELVQSFGKLFKRAAGNASSLADEAARRCIGYMHAPGSNMMLAEDA
ncbi:MAG: hypothetical protein R3C28_28795 [Pirellulaceae bacterium]